MRRALGRLLGIVLTLAMISVVALAALARLAPALGAPPPANGRTLPLFFNAKPANVHDLAEQLVRQIAAGDNAEHAERELVRLGGAALPHVLPELDALRPAARGRIALALAPIAIRMGLATPEELRTTEQALAFWGRFWQDHAFDFRPQLVRRLVQRLAERSSMLARDDLRRVDTYAVPDLVAALGRIRTQEDVHRARRLTSMLAHVTTRGPVVPRNATVAEARSAARTWRRYFVEEGFDFVTLDGPKRLTAAFAQTQYGRWFGRLIGVIRVGQEQQSALGVGLAPAARTLSAYAGALFGAIALAVAWVALELRTRGAPAAVARVFAGLCIALPTALLLGLLGKPASPIAQRLLCAAVVALLGGALLSRLHVASLGETRARSDISAPLLVGGALRALPSSLPWLFTALMGAELFLEVDGIALAVVRGLRAGDVTPGMTAALGGGLIAAALATTADGVLGWSRVELRPALLEVDGASRRPLVFASIAAVLVLGIFGAGWGGAASGAQLGWSEVAQGARGLLGYGLVACAVATLVGFGLGAAAANGPRLIDALLVRAVELTASLPAALWAAAFAHGLGRGFTLALVLGLLRAIDVAWMLRIELLRRARSDAELGLRSLGHYPLASYVRERMRPAVAAAAVAVALTPAWWVAVGSVGWLVGAPALPGRRGWDALFSGGPATLVPVFTAAAILSVITITLVGFLTRAPRRLGAFRASVPPPPPQESPDLHQD